MSSVNKIIILGRVGSDPEVRTTQSGTKVAQVSIATSEKRTGADGQKIEETQWHRAICWDKKAELIEQYVHKGDLIYVEGQIQYRKYDKDGVTKYTTEIMVREIKLMPRAKSEDTTEEHQVFPGGQEQAPPPESEEDLPF